MKAVPTPVISPYQQPFPYPLCPPSYRPLVNNRYCCLAAIFQLGQPQPCLFGHIVGLFCGWWDVDGGGPRYYSSNKMQQCIIDVYRKYEYCADLMAMFHFRCNIIKCPYGTGYYFLYGRHPINELMGYFQNIPTGLSGCFILIFFITMATKCSNA